MKLLQRYLSDPEKSTKQSYWPAFLLLAFLCLIGPAEIETGIVDFSFQTLMIMVTGLVLNPVTSFIVLLIYLILGASGLPVFAGYTGGFEHLSGPTCGFLIWFPVLALLFSYSLKYTLKHPILVGLSAFLNQLILLLAGFSYMLIMDYLSVNEMRVNIIGLLPGLLLKSILILFIYLAIFRFFRIAEK